MNKKTLVSILVVAIIISFTAGFYVSKSSRPAVEQVILVNNAELNKPGRVDFSLFWDAWKLVEDKFINRSKLEAQKMVYGAISGMLGALGDPYTVFLPPEENKKFSEDMKGEFGGIGAEIGIRKDVLTIISPLEGSPAKKAGLLPQDKILKVDDKSTDNITIDEAISLIRGPKGTEVKLTIFREGWKDTKDFKIIRDIIKVPVLKWELKDKDIAHIQLYHFTENSDLEFKKAVQEILNSNAKKILLDLRGNPGGYLETATEIASWFTEKGQTIAVEDFGDSKKTEYKSEGYAKLISFPVVVLVDSGSASASEILVGALRDLRGIKLVGTKTFGKGSVQQLEQMRGGASIKITVAKWLTPSGKSIMDDGLEPDVKIELTEDDINNNRDPQLDKALDMLR